VANTGIGLSLMKNFGVPAVLQRHILSRCFVMPEQRRWPQNISCPSFGFQKSLRQAQGKRSVSGRADNCMQFGAFCLSCIALRAEM